MKPHQWICLKCQMFFFAEHDGVAVCPCCGAQGSEVRREPDWWNEEMRVLVREQGAIIRRMREGCLTQWEQIVDRYSMIRG